MPPRDWTTLTLRSRITRNRRGWAVLAVLQTGSLGLSAGLLAAGLLSAGAWLGWSAVTVIFLASSFRHLWLTTRALRTYDANPVAAYIAEIRNAFGPSGQS